MEAKQALKQMKNGKAAGDDGLQVEILKMGGPEIVEWMVRLFDTAFREEKVLEDWQQAVICPIYKSKGRKTD